MKNKILNSFALALSLTVVTTGAIAASGDKTAAYLKANAPEYVNTTVEVDVVYVRVIPSRSDNEKRTVFAVYTIDEDNRAPGGVIIAIADADDRTRIANKYGTNIERDSGGPETKSMRGLLKQVELGEEGSGRGPLYLDLTAEGVEPDPQMVGKIKAAYGPEMKARRGKKR